MKYFDELKRTMEWIAQQPKSLFVGQTVAGHIYVSNLAGRFARKNFRNAH